MEGNKSVLFSNRAKLPYISDIPPDDFIIKPPEDHVLCRDSEGNPTAIYKNNIWDLNPYRLSASRIRPINFGNFIDCEDLNFKMKLINESKFIIYILMYFSGGGRTGKLSASTLEQYWFFLRSLSKFCIENLNNDLAKGISVFDVLSNSTYLLAFTKRPNFPSNQLKKLGALLSVLNKIDPALLGFDPCPRNIFSWSRVENQQHPVIPSRIYIELMNHYEALAEDVLPFKENIKALIISMSDRYAGLAIATQECLMTATDRQLRPTIEELIKDHGLEKLLFENFPIEHPTRQSFGAWILRIQFLLKNLLHLYTGMRHEECLRIQYDCLGEYEMTEPVLDQVGTIIDASRMISLVSTTTKFSGYKRTGSWIAPDFVLKVIEVAKSITEGLAHLYGVEPSKCPIFLSPSIIRSENIKFSTTNFTNKLARGADAVLSKDVFRITKDDLNELSQTDPDRNFSKEQIFTQGEYWPLTSHQFRRSLAFYAANSGFVSLGTVSAQFKHLAKTMAQYYSRRHENLLTVFGEWSDKRRGYVIAQSHVLHEFQMAVPTNAVNLLFQDMFDSKSTLMGGTGSSLEKLKRRVEDGEISILIAKDETMKMAVKGEISYRKTLLGGCTKVGPCNEFMLGDLTACLSCEGANIRYDKLEFCISNAHSEMNIYPEESAEYQIAKMEATKLLNFRDKKLIVTVED